MKIRILLIATMAITALTASAVPAKRVTKKVQQADGTILELTLRGDEHFSFYTDKDGTPFLLDATGKARQITMQKAKQAWTEQKQARLAKVRRKTPGKQSRKLAPNEVGKPKSSTTGNHRGLVILMQFPDVPFSTADPKATFQRFFNETGYSDFGMSGSVKDYFLKQSYNQLNIDFDVVGPYTTKNNMEYYGKPYTDEQGYSHNDRHPALMVAEGVDAASEEVDFSNYDWDKDGEVDQVFVVYAGYAQAQGADENTIWPHEYSLAGESATRTYNNCTIDTYGCASELSGDGVHDIGILDGIGTACHEFSHCMGLPDMYDTTDMAFGMGDWDVMCSGNYNNNSRTPAGYTSYERMFSGWLQPTEINTMTRINGMKPLANNQEAYILYNEKNKDEYYLLENRQPVEFDSALPGHGLLVLHVDYNEGAWNTNSVNVEASHQRMTIIPADNKDSYPTEAGDPFPGTSGVTSLTNYTTPAAIVYTGQFMNKPIDNITEDNENKTVSFVLCRPELAIPEPDNGKQVENENAFSVMWQAISGAVGYELELTEIGKASDDPAEALLNSFDFSGCYSKTNGLTDISSKMSDYGLPGWSGSKLFTTPEKLRLGTSSATGKVRTPTWKVPQSSDMTIVMGAKVFKAGTPVAGDIQIAFGNEGEQATFESQSFTVNGDEKLVFNFSVTKNLFWINILPKAQMYLNYLALYDGKWTAEQLGLNANNAKADGPRYAAEKQTMTTTDNSYTFTGLNTNKRYIYRVRALGEESTFSQWSEEKTFEFPGSTAINVVKADAIHAPAVMYNLQGQRVNNGYRGIVIRNGRKYVK